MKHLISVSIFLGVLTGLLIDTGQRTIGAPIHYAQAEEAPRVILIGTTTKEKSVEEKIRTTFPESPDLFVQIAKCESGLKPNAHNPKSNDGGVFQINERAHGERLRALELDPFNVDDNLTYARMLYEANGTRDWNASKHCWNK